MMDGYANLFSEVSEVMWPNGPTAVQFESRALPLEDLISNVNAVPVTETGEWILFNLAMESGRFPVAQLSLVKDL